MLATGGSAAAAIDFIKARGGKKIIFMCLIAAPEGIEALQKAHPDVDIFIAAKDEKLNENAYIVPGLGDAGAVSYTHLDVYKRQVWSYWSCRRIFRLQRGV